MPESVCHRCCCTQQQRWWQTQALSGACLDHVLQREELRLRRVPHVWGPRLARAEHSAERVGRRRSDPSPGGWKRGWQWQRRVGGRVDVHEGEVRASRGEP